ncbi:MAG: VOC family protein [Dehalococcoidia bacterium]|jgi:PhnB protein
MLVPSLFFNGKCEEAIEQYKRAFGADVAVIQPFPEEENNKGIMYSEIYLHGQRMMLSDMGGNEPPGFVIVFDNLDDMMKSWEIMKEGGEVRFPPQKTEASICEAILRDRFGITWGMMVDEEHPFRKKEQ